MKTRREWPGTLVEKPIKLGGKEGCVLAPDIVGEPADTEDAVLVQKAVGGRPAFWMRESIIQRVREANPDHQVYGLWQTLYTSGYVDTRIELQVVPTNKREGYYLFQSADGPVAGLYRGERLPPALDKSPKDATEIDFGERFLKCPEKPARTLAELRAEHRDAQRKHWSVRGAVALVVVLCAALADWWLDKEFQQRLQQYKTLEVSVAKLNGEALQLRMVRLDRWPNQSAKVAPYVVLARLDGQIKVAETSMDAPRKEAVLTERVRNLPDWGQAKRTQDGGWALQW